MSFTNWNGLQTIAEKLAQADDEASFRSAINRAYYAAFQLSMEYAKTRGFIRNRDGTDHSRIVDQMKSYRETYIKEAGRALERLQVNRNKADYDERIDIKKPIVSASISMADDIIKTLQSWRPY